MSAIIEETPLYSIAIDRTGGYTVARKADNKDVYLQGETAGIFGQTLADIRAQALLPAPMEWQINWLCSNEFTD